MLNIYLGRDQVDMDEVEINPITYFNYHKKPGWFKDPFVIEMCETIDPVKHVVGEAFLNPRENGISSMQLSGGLKILICIYEEPEKLWYGSTMGDNCCQFLEQIARKTDVRLLLGHFMDIPDSCADILYVNGKKVDIVGYETEYCLWGERLHAED